MATLGAGLLGVAQSERANRRAADHGQQYVLQVVTERHRRGEARHADEQHAGVGGRQQRSGQQRVANAAIAEDGDPQRRGASRHRQKHAERGGLPRDRRVQEREECSQAKVEGEPCRRAQHRGGQRRAGDRRRFRGPACNGNSAMPRWQPSVLVSRASANKRASCADRNAASMVTQRGRKGLTNRYQSRAQENAAADSSLRKVSPVNSADRTRRTQCNGAAAPCRDESANNGPCRASAAARCWRLRCWHRWQPVTVPWRPRCHRRTCRC